MANLIAEMIFAPETGVAPAQSITPGASPYTYQSTREGCLSISGGTVSVVAMARAGVSITLGMINGIVPLSTGDNVTITYAVAPTLYFFPR